MHTLRATTALAGTMETDDVCFYLNFPNALYFSWSLLVLHIIYDSTCIAKSSREAITVSVTRLHVCANIKWMIVYVQTSRKKDVFQSAPYWSSILGHSECMYIPFLIFTAYITISVKCKLTWVAPRVTLVAYRAWLLSFRSSYILCIQAEKRQQRKARKDFTFCLFPAREY